MDGTIDLELYTISIIRLNNAIERLNSQTHTDEIKAMFEDSLNDLESLYDEMTKDLNSNEIIFDEYFLFFQHTMFNFPKYIDDLKTIENEELNDVISSLINVFYNFNKLANDFINNLMLQ